MLMRALISLGDNLLDESNDESFHTKDVAWQIVIDAEGHTVSTNPSRRIDDRPDRASRVIPRQPSGSGNSASQDPTQIKPILACGSAKYLFGAVGNVLAKNADAALMSHALLADRGHKCTGDRGLAALAAWLGDERSDDRAAAAESIREISKSKPDKAIAGDIEVFLAGDLEAIHSRPAVRGFWSSVYAEYTSGGDIANIVQCLGCGLMAPAVRTHPVIGGTAHLVSFDKGAYESLGWQQGENAPMCRRCVDRYAAAMASIIRGNTTDGGSIPIERFSVEGTRYGVWSSSLSDSCRQVMCDIVGDLDDLQVGVPQDDPLDVVRAARGQVAGGPVDTLIVVGFSQASNGRWIVPSVTVGAAAEVVSRSEAWRTDLRGAASPLAGWRVWGKQRGLPSLYALTYAVLPVENKAWIGPKGHEVRAMACPKSVKTSGLVERTLTGFLEHIVSGRPLARDLLSTAITNLEIELLRSPDPKTSSLSFDRVYHLISLIGILRKGTAMDQTPFSPGYLCGQAFGLLARIQQLGLERPPWEANEAPLVRGLGGARTMPSRVLPDALGQAMGAHLPKAARSRPGSAAKHRRALYAVMAALNMPSGIPNSLSIEEQADFMLGLCHALAGHILGQPVLVFAPKAGTSDPDDEDDDLPAAA